MELIEKSCALCALQVKNPIVLESLPFCCHGCLTVYQILFAKNQLEGEVTDHPIFQQAVQAGLISNPALLEQIRNNRVDPEDSQKLHLEIGNMWCPSCAEVIRLLLLQKKGVLSCVVDYSTDLASIEFAPRYLSKENILQKIQSFGYDPKPLDSSERRAVSFSLILRFAIAVFFTMNVMMFSYPLYAPYFDGHMHGFALPFAWLSGLAAIPVVGYCAYPIIRRFFTSLQVGLFGMETLVVIAVASAFSLSFYNLFQGNSHVYFDSMSVVITLVLLGKIIESKGKFKAKQALLRLSLSLPRRGRKQFSDGARFVPIKEIIPGDRVIAFTGEKIVLDGEVVIGEGLCDEALMTGEAIPVRKGVGSSLIGGAVLKQGSLTYLVTRPAEESALKRIVEMVEQDIGHKASYQRAVDPIVRWFVPFVLLFASLVAVFQMEVAALRFLTILLISCPCAIGIAAPLAESHLLNALVELGAIVRNRGCLSLLGKETLFVFDKTGTVTKGEFEVIKGLQSPILKGLASQSIHPISVAIASSIQEKEVVFSSTEEIPGKGIRGVFEKTTYYLGSKVFLEEQGIGCPQPENQTTVFFGKEGSCPATLVLSDGIKEGIPDLLKTLPKAILLSGDGEEVVKSVAKACGFEAYYFGVSPLEKRAFIEELRAKGETVCMVGDGINDAPALTASHVGISVVSATDISIQVSDLLLTTNDLSVIPKLRSLALFTKKIIRQNLFWAFFYNVVGMGLAAFGVLTPLFSAAAMVVSSLIVLFNARRVTN